MGAHDRHRRRAGGRRLRRAGARAVAPQADAVAAPVRRARRRHRRSAPTSSPTCAGRRCSTTSSSPPPTIARLAAEARPLVRSRRPLGRARPGRPRGGGRRAGRAGRHHPAHRRRDPAPRRSASRARRSPAASRVEGGGWAADLLGAAPERVDRAGHRAPRASSASCAATRPRRSAGSGFLDAAGLGGCLALDMGLGKTPTMLAHLARTAGDGPALVIAPPAVVGNWAAEAARFTPGLRVVVHHGAAARRGRRARGRGRPAPTSSSPPTAPRCATSRRCRASRGTAVVLDEAQAIKNPANETAQQLRRIPARSRLALTGTPIENGLGDLWAILDFTNPGLVGRPAARSSPSSSRRAGEAALRALNGILVFRRTKAEPEIAAELPDRIDELDHCTMTARADRPLPGGARRARRSPATCPRASEPRKGADPRRHHRAQADLQPPGRLPGRRPPARRPLGQARPARGDRRVGVRGRRAGPRSSPTSPSGACGWPTTSPSVTGMPDRLLPRRPGPRRPRPA